jgi:hypothetical protein
MEIKNSLFSFSQFLLQPRCRPKRSLTSKENFYQPKKTLEKIEGKNKEKKQLFGLFFLKLSQSLLCYLGRFQTLLSQQIC